jgi:hypothetical protein
MVLFPFKIPHLIPSVSYSFNSNLEAIMSGKFSDSKVVVPIETIQNRILIMRERKVILDADLAKLYATTTSRLNQQVHRNRQRFSEEFVFKLIESEKREVVTNCDNLRQ